MAKDWSELLLFASVWLREYCNSSITHINTHLELQLAKMFTERSKKDCDW